jgi:hypothetical protein
MANVTANVSTVDVTVTSTPSNITVTDVDTNVSLTTLTTAVTNVAVTTTQLEVNVAPLTQISNVVIRAALSVDDTGGDGSLTYNSITGVFTYTGPNQNEANARISAAPVQVRSHLGHNLGVANYNPATGIITIPGDTDDISEGTNLFFSNIRAREAVFSDQIISGKPDFFMYGAGLNITSTGDSAAFFLTADTDDIPEGSSNLYFTTGRANSAIDDYMTGGYGITFSSPGTISITNADVQAQANIVFNAEFATKTTDDLPEGNSNLYYTTDRANSAIQNKLTDGTFSGNLDVTGNATFTGNVAITNNLSVERIDEVAVKDNYIYIARDNDTPGGYTQAGLWIDRDSRYSGQANLIMRYNWVTGYWEFNHAGEGGAVYYPMPRSTDDLAEGSTNEYYSTAKMLEDFSNNQANTSLFYANTFVSPQSVADDYPYFSGNADVWISGGTSIPSTGFARFMQDNYYGTDTYVNQLDVNGVTTYQTFTKVLNGEERYGSGDDAIVLRLNAGSLGDFKLEYDPNATATLNMNTAQGHTKWYKQGSTDSAHLQVAGNVRVDGSHYIKGNLFINDGITFDVDGGGATINLLGIGADSEKMFISSEAATANVDYANAELSISALPSGFVSQGAQMGYFRGDGDIAAITSDGWWYQPDRYDGTTQTWYKFYDTAQANTDIVAYFADVANGPFTINGDLDVAGNINYVNVEDLLVNDQSITLNYGNATARDAFIYVDRSGSALNNAHIKWNETSDQWEIYDGTSTYVIPRTTSDLTEGTNLYYTELRANTAIDARVTKTFVDALGVDYNSLSNLPTIPTHTSNLINDSGFITSATANVISVNGATGVVVLDTDDIAEGTNKYYSTTLFNADFATKTTSDLTEGANLYFTTGRANSAIDAYVTGGNAISVASGVVSLDNTAVTPKTYGDATNVPQFTVDQQGRITAVSNVAISGGGAAANSFGIISVAGQSNVEADVATDQVTFVAGSGVTITTDAGTDSITFNSTGGYGNVDVANFLENGFGSNSIVTTGNITADYFFATEEFIGDLDGAISVGVFNNTASTLTKGQAVYITGAQGDEACVAPANNLVASQMPAMGIIKENISAGQSGQAVTSGTMNFSSHGFSIGAELYVNSGGLLTETKPSGEGALIQKIGKALAANFILVQGAGRTNATPNLDDGNIFVGNGSNYAATADLDNFTYAISSSADIATTANVDAEVVNTRRQVYTFPSSTDKNFVDLDNFDTPGAANIILISGKFSVNHLFDTQGLGADTWAVKSGNANVAVANTWIRVSGNGVTEFYGEPTRAEGTLVANGQGTGFQVTNASEFTGNSTFLSDIEVEKSMLNFGEWTSSDGNDYDTQYKRTEVRKYDANLIADANALTSPSMVISRYGGTQASPSTFGDSNVVGRYAGAIYKPRTLQFDHPLYGWVNYASSPAEEYVAGIYYEAGADTGQYTGPTFTASGFDFRFQKNVSQGTIKFRTTNATTATATDVDGVVDGSWFNGGLNKANSTIMYIDDQVHIGREDNGTSFSFPTTAGSTNQFLTLDANSDLQWTSTLNNVTLTQFQETKVDLGSVSGDQSSALDAASGSIYTLTATGGITINSLANAVAGTSMTIIITQDGTGSHALTSSMKFAGADKTLSTAPGSIDIISVFYDGTNYYASLTKGYA